MNARNLVWGFAPFALFSIVTPLAGPVAGAAIGLAAALTIVLAGLHRGGVPVLPLVTAVILAGIGVVALAGGSGTDHVLTDYGRGIAGLALAAYILATARLAPFTAQFARQAAPERVWHSPAFLRLNTRISTAWGCAVLAIAVAHLGAAALPADDGHPVVRLLLAWGVPVLAALQALRYTRQAAESAAAHH